jgi:hypothetical protein
MKFNNNTKIYNIYIVFFIIIQVNIISNSKLKTSINKIYSNKNNTKLENYNKNYNIESNLNQSSYSINENSNPNPNLNNKENFLKKINELEKASFFKENEIKDINEKIKITTNEEIYNDILDKDNLINEDLILKLNDLEKIITKYLLKNNNKNKLKNFEEKLHNEKYKEKSAEIEINKRNLINKEKENNQMKKHENEENLKMEYFQKKYLEEFLSIKSEKMQYLEDHNVFLFYHSLSLVMLSMLGGGVLSMLFILFFSYKNENHKIMI